MDDIFISDFLNLTHGELDRLGIFDSIITSDSSFFINVLRLKMTDVPQFKGSYGKILRYFGDIMTLLTASKEMGDRFYQEA